VTFDFKDFTGKQRAFCEEFVLDMRATAAAQRAGYAQAASSAYQNLSLPHCQAYIEYLQDERAKRLQITQDDVLRRLWAIASADTNEIVQYRRTCCRFCYGKNHRYQWSAQEHERACEEAKRAGWPKPEAPGGNDYDHTKDPNPDCPECRGEGDGKVFVNDTRNLSETAREAYAGAKVGRDGLEVKVHDKMLALQLVGKHLGMFKEKIEHSGEVSAPTLNLTLTGPTTPTVPNAQSSEDSET